MERRFVHAHGGPSGFLTLSIGIAGFRPQREVTSAKLLAEADQALYEAKAAGRNTVVCAGPGLSSPVHG